MMLAAIDPVTAIVTIGLSLAAAYFNKRNRPKTPFDDQPSALATRGAFVPYVRGVRRVGPIVALVGGRRTTKEKVKGGKGGFFDSSPKERIYHEHGVHVLAVGPIEALHGIYSGGKKILGGPITRTSHPSGSSISVSNEGTFRIYWGEKDQPVDSFLADADRIGIASRWPLYCYVVWNDKRLGSAARWQDLTYVIEGRVQSTGLVDTPAYMIGSALDEGGTNAITGFTNGAEGTGKFTITGYHADRFEANEIVRILGNTFADGDYIVLKAESDTSTTDVFFVGGVSGADANGTLQATEEQQDDGINLAHVIWELLFGAAPYGMALDQADWDLPSLEALGTLMVTEDIKGGVIGQGGQNIDTLLAQIFQDIGVMIPVNYTTGKIEFKSVRVEAAGVNIAADMILPPLPEIESNHGEKPQDSIIWAFADRELNGRTNTIYVDDLGQAEQLEHKRMNTINIASTVNFNTAALIGNRRELEELTSKTKTNIHSNRDARTIMPGDAISANGFGRVQRVWGNTQDPLTGKVTLEVSADFFGVALNTFLNTKPGVSSILLPAAPDLANAIVEVPAGLMPSQPDQAIIVPRIRAHSGIFEADIHLSLDDTTFTYAITEADFQTGGVLDAELPAAGRTRTDEIEFTALGPDIAQVLDLTLDEANWRLGRQLMVIDSAAGTEMCYVRSITSLGGGSYRANDVIRGRYCTKKLTHVINSNVFIFENSGISIIQDITITPDTAIFVKSQPKAAGIVSLAAISSITKTLHGEGRKPRDPVDLQLTAPTAQHRNEYSTSDDLTITWDRCLDITDVQGAGASNAGSAITTGPITGNYTILWTTAGDVVQRTDTVTDLGTITLSNANLQTAFSGEPASLKAKVFNSDLGLNSRTIEITITLV